MVVHDCKEVGTIAIDSCKLFSLSDKAYALGVFEERIKSIHYTHNNEYIYIILDTNTTAR